MEQVKEQESQEQPEITLDLVNEKIEKGEELSPEEEDLYLKNQEPVDGYDKGDYSKKKLLKKEESNEEDAEETTQDEDEKTNEEQAKDEILDDDKLSDKEEFIARLENDLDREEKGERADLKDYTPREKAYFHRMLRDRKNRQEAQKKLNEAIFREKKLQHQIEESKKQPEKDPLDSLKDKDPNDFLTVAEVKELFAQKKEPAKAEEPKEQPQVDQRWMKYLQLSDKEAREQYEDYDAVMELSKDLVDGNPEYLKEIAESIEKGENPAVKTYELIKSDKEFETLYPLAEAKVKARNKKPEKSEEKSEEKKQEKSPDNNKVKKAEKALETRKTKTTGSISSGEDKNTDELSLDDIMNMPDKEFAKLPKQKQDYYLRKFGA